VTLENFAVYAGREEFDLVPRTKFGNPRPVILFGGKNGAGKTTLLDGIRLALYGKGAMSGRSSGRDYESFLCNSIHRSRQALVQPSHASVAVEFDYVCSGEKKTYRVERAWQTLNSRTATEHLTVLRDGVPLEEIEPDHWNDFVEGIVPQGLSQLFFFDGEKIKSIAEDATGSEALAESIRSLLGLNLVERLGTDLGICSSRIAKALNKRADRDRIAQVDESLESLTEQLSACRRDLAQKQTQIAGVDAEIRRKEEFLGQEGYGFATRREDLKKEEATLATKIDAIQSAIREECDGFFPLALCPGIASALALQLGQEEEFRAWDVVNIEVSHLQHAVDVALDTVESSAGRADSTPVIGKVRSALSDVFAKRLAQPATLKGVQRVHDLAERDVAQILGWVQSAKNSAAKVQRLCGEMEKASRVIHDTRAMLNKAPDESTLKPHVEELAALNQRMGAMREEHRRLGDTQSGLQNQIAGLEREKEKLIAKAREREGDEGTLRLVHNVQTALVQYRDRLTTEKVAVLRHAVADCFNRLCRKGDVLHKIEVDPKSFGVMLYDRQNRTIHKEDLSAGEKQIFAVSLLWGLAKTSGRPLPVIVDTPLARLDGDHRRNLITNYFPYASHQVLVLSTDTEVDQKLFAALSGCISHCYHLEYDDIEGRTKPVEGYFWKEAPSA